MSHIQREAGAGRVVAADTLDILGYRVFGGSLDVVDVRADKRVILTLNPHSYVLAKGDDEFARALKSCDVLVPDGSGIVLAARMIHGMNVPKVSGSDLHIHLLERLNERGEGKVFYLGSSEDVLAAIKQKVASEYSKLEVHTLSPPFADTFTEAQNEAMIAAINEVQPDVLFVGMTAPKQEKWLAKNRDRIDARVCAAIGAVFDFYTGNVTRPSEFWIRLHLEWLVRLLGEPGRLWRRTFISTPIFLFDVVRAVIGVKR